MASGKVEEALAWLREVQGWDSYRLIYPRGCRIYSVVVGRVYKAVVEAEYTSLRERLACLRYAARLPEYKVWRKRQKELCLHVYGGYERQQESREEDFGGAIWGWQ